MANHRHESMFNPYSVIKAINYNRETKQHTCKIEKGGTV